MRSESSRQRIGNGHRGHETAVDRDFCKLRTLVAHGQDRTAKGTKQRRERLGQGFGGIRAPDHVALRACRPLDRASKHQGLDLIEQTLRRKRQTAGEARRHLAQHDHQTVRGKRGDHVRDQCRNGREIALATRIGRNVRRDIDDVAGGKIARLAGEGYATGNCRGQARRDPVPRPAAGRLRYRARAQRRHHSRSLEILSRRPLSPIPARDGSVRRSRPPARSSPCLRHSRLSELPQRAIKLDVPRQVRAVAARAERFEVRIFQLPGRVVLDQRDRILGRASTREHAAA